MLSFMSKLTQPRPLADLYRAASNSALEKQGAKMIEAIDDVHSDRGLAQLPTNLLGLVEKHFKKKLNEMSGGERQFAESVCISFNPNSIAAFTENYLGARIAAQPTADFIKAYNARLVGELETELSVVREWLAYVWACSSAPGNVDECGPVQEIERLLFLARQAAVTGDGGEHGVRSIMSRLR
jgi:hypothetical protein